ncbi:hypothetical protein BGP76_01095 [Reichenbachiella sp. MSK19-1]|nr:hypothetical protein BGP76_01095 [Reichenbachiella sp. MSK19-1]
MIQLMTIVRQSASSLFLNRQYLSDFKSLMRALTSGNVTIISTKFRSDFFYHSPTPNNTSILKLWSLYANINPITLDPKDLITHAGDKKSLTKYFQSINHLSTNRYYYRQYKQAFLDSIYSDDPNNTITQMILACDEYLINKCRIKRMLLVEHKNLASFQTLTKDTFSLAMRILHSETHVN